MDQYERIAETLNALVKPHNFQVAPKTPKGKPGSNVKSMREYRLQLIDKNRDTSKALVAFLKSELAQSKEVTDVRFNPVSPNSSKFSSYDFKLGDVHVDLVIARGANKGETFETNFVSDMARHFNANPVSSFVTLVEEMGRLNTDFRDREIIRVEQRKGSTKKAGVPIEKLGEVIGDVVLTDSAQQKWYISLKDVNGDTFSAFDGAATLFDSKGTIQHDQKGADFVRQFGVDLYQLQVAFDKRNNINKLRPRLREPKFDAYGVQKIFERAWGMNYFYVRRKSNGWQVKWIDRQVLNELIQGMRVTEIRYPGPTSKQLTIFCSNAKMKYKVEVRNSKGGEYPNDIKFKILP